MSTPKIIDLQRRLDEKLVDPGSLNPEQRAALDEAFKDGTLTGYKSVSDMIKERRIARQDIARDVKSALEPLAPTSLFSLGLKRGTLAAAGDIFGSFTPYVLDGKKLAVEAREAALAGKSVSYIPEVKAESGQKSIKAFSNLISKLPGLRNLGVFKKTSEVLDNALTASAAATTGKLAFSQAARTEIKSQLLGATGAATGSVTYDVINLPAKFVAGTNEDMAKLDQNEINRLPFADRVTYHAVDNFRTALMWNAGTFGLFSLGSAVSGGLRKFLNVNPATLRSQNENIDRLALPVSSVLTSEGLGGAGGIYKGINKVLTVLPPGAGEPLKTVQRFTGVSLARLTDDISRAVGRVPLLHTEVLANAVNSSIRKTFEESGAIYSNLYKMHGNAMDQISSTLTKYTNELITAYRAKNPIQTRLLGDEQVLRAMFPAGMDIPFIATNNLRQTTDDILNLVQKGTTEQQAARRAFRGIYDAANDPSLRFVREMKQSLNEFSKVNGGDFLTPTQFNSLRQSWNANYPNVKFDSNQQKNIFRVLEAFEKDFNFVNQAPTAAFLFDRNPKLGRAFQAIAENLGPDKANGFLKDFQNNLQTANEYLIKANYAFGQSVNFYNSNNMAKIARRMDPAMLTAKQGLDFFQEGKVTDVQGMDMLFRAAFDPKTGTQEGVEDLYKLIGGSKKYSPETQENARYLMKLLLYRKSFDALNKNAVVRLSGVTGEGAVMAQPFVERGITTYQEAIEVLNKQSPLFRKTVQELIEKDFKLGTKGVKIEEDELLNYQRRAVTSEVIREALKENIPINQTIFLTRETNLGESPAGRLGFMGGFKMTERRPLQPFQEDVVGTIEKAKEAFITEKGITREVSAAERKIAQRELENIEYRMQGYQGFKFRDFEDELGLTTNAGVQQLITGYKLANNLTEKQAAKHVENIRDVIGAMRRQFTETPIGDASTYVTRSAIFRLGAGGLGAAGGLIGFGLGGTGGGILGVVLTAAMMKGGAHIINSPKFTKSWLDLYSTGERLDINKLNALQPPQRAALADLLNYISTGDPDAPRIDPSNIDEKAVIKYLQGKTLTSVPTDKGLYNMLPEEIKDRFNPERIKLKELKGQTKIDFNTYLNGRQVAKFREDLIDNLDTERGRQVAFQPRVREFISNPMDLQVPAAAKVAVAQPVIPQVTADVYQGLFPRDAIGTTIAQQQTSPTPPMMKKGGFVNAKV